MILKNLKLLQFKNHREKSFEFSRQINCFVGNNGIGKTNLLDALYYLSFGKSFLGNSDNLNITEEEEFFVIETEVENEDKNDIIKIIHNKATKKVIKKNEKTYDRIADHIGYLPVVLISPYDSNLISDSGESRRKFLDALISQTDSEYLYSLIQYQKIIQQRNALLKFFAKTRSFEPESLSIYNEPLTKYGNYIFNKRKDFIQELNPLVQHFYQVISNGKERVEVVYESHLADNSFEDLLEQNKERDRLLTYTSHGIHKDDLLFNMNGILIKRIGSQGQQKSFLIGLKLAQFSQVKARTGKIPILLLDDIFDKLDDIRVSQLISLVNKENFGQIFITDTNEERTKIIVKQINEESKIFQLNDFET